MTERIDTQCCIVGGGPAGMMLGHLLARAGIDVIVLEKHKDFLRDFRGDTLQPQTLEIMHQLGLADELLRLPHEKVPQLHVVHDSEDLVIADYSHLKVQYPFIAVLPQWDFLNFLAEKSSAYPHFHLRTKAGVTGLIEEGGTVVGVRAEGPEGELEVRADLVVGCDGRNSTVRGLAGLEVEDFGASIDVLWWRISRRADDPTHTKLLLRFGVDDVMKTGGCYARIHRPEHFQCGYFISKGAAAEMRQGDIEDFRRVAADLDPILADRLDELGSWADVPLLTVKIDRLKQWYRPGLLCIADAAHAMSPLGGLGINYAIQDAVATANILAGPLKRGELRFEDLRRVQRRRMRPTAITQKIQLMTQERGLGPLTAGKRPGLPEWNLKLLRSRIPLLPRMLGRFEGLGIRRERVRLDFASSSGSR